MILYPSSSTAAKNDNVKTGMKESDRFGGQVEGKTSSSIQLQKVY